MSNQTMTATSYDNVVSGNGRSGMLILTSSHVAFTYAVKTGRESSNTKTIQVPWSSVVSHQVSPPSMPVHKLKIVTRIFPAANSSNNSQPVTSKQIMTKIFVFPDRQSLIAIRDDMKRRISESLDLTQPASNSNKGVDGSQLRGAKTAGREGSKSAPGDTGANALSVKNNSSVSGNSSMSHSQNEDDSQGNGNDINKQANVDDARDQVAFMVLSEADELIKRRNAALTNNDDTEARTPSTASKRRQTNSKRKPVDPGNTISKDTTSTSSVIPDSSKPKPNGKRSQEDYESGEFDVRAMVRERQSMMGDAGTDGYASDGVNRQQQRQKSGRLDTAITAATQSMTHSVQEADLISRESTPNSFQLSQPTIQAPVLRRSQNLRTPTRVGAIAVTPTQSFNNYGGAGQASSTLLENPDPSGVLVQATLVEDEAGLVTTSQRIQFEEETRIRILDELVVAAGPAIIVDPAAHTRKTCRRMCVLVVGVLILMAIILGSVLGNTSPGGLTKTYIVITQAPTTSSIPSLSPSITPSLSHAPTDVPTNTPTNIPSISPTTTPDNRYCTDAKKLFVGEPAHEEDFWGSASILEAPSFSPLDDVGDFGNSAPSFSPLDDFGDFGNAAPSFSPLDSFGGEYGNTLGMVVTCEFGNAYLGPVRWYSMTGVGPVTATTCDPRTTTEAIIQVYTDVDSCQGGLDPSVCAPNLVYYSGSTCATVSWDSIVGEEYLIQVAGAEDFSGYSGFGGSLYLQLFNNDLCENAFRPLALTGSAQTYFGSLTGATADRAPSCGGASNSSQPGIWYLVAGIGGLVQASTCTGTIIDTQLSIYQGSCANLECVGGVDDVCGSQSALTWNAESGVTYYILVHGGSGVTSGTFSLTIESGIARNEICSTADPIVVPEDGEVVVGVPLQSAKADPEVSSFGCHTNIFLFGHPLRGVWYSVNATGDMYTATLRDDVARLSVFGYNGSCDSLSCIGSAFGRIPFSWMSTLGQQYLIYVYFTRNDESGYVEMALTAATP